MGYGVLEGLSFQMATGPTRNHRAGEGCFMASCLMMRSAEEFLVRTGVDKRLGSLDALHQ
jgi:hypothetical protein